MYTFANTPPAGGGKRAGTSRRSASDVYEQLRRDLRSGRIAGWERLSEEPLAVRFGVSRTPVREALTRLDSEGLIERRNGGLYMALPSFKELSGLYELRVTLELRGITRAMEDGSIVHDASLLEAELARWCRFEKVVPAPTPLFVSEDEQFHVAVLGSSGNPALPAALQSVNDKIRSVRMYDYLTEDRIASTIQEHTQILELLLRRRLSQAYEALHDHIGASQKVVMERASQAFANFALITVSRKDNP